MGLDQRRTVAVIALSAELLGGCSIDARDVGVIDDRSGLGGSDAEAEHGQGDTGPESGGTLGGSISSRTRFDFGNLEVQGDPSSTTWTISNGGTSATSVPSLANGNPNELVVESNRCTAALRPGASCSIDVSFRPTGAGPRSGTLTLVAKPGGSATFEAVAHGMYRLTVINSSAGATGIVNASTTELDCGPTCSVLVDEGARLTLQARTSNESGALFTGWSGAGCPGAFRDCELIVRGPTTVTARFAPRLNNLVFGTSALLPADLGGVLPYDRECNLIASAAGINDVAGNAYVAVMSDSVSSLRTRLGTSARGWVRMDGAPFADTQAALFEGAALNAVVFDENGRDIRTGPIITGSLRDGTVSSDDTCLDWTSTTGTAFGGSLSAGSSNWITGFASPCEPRHVICMGRTRTAPLVFPEVGERTIWLSTTAYSVGAAQTPDEKCQAERPPGVVTARALIATTQRAASALLDLDAVYARPDGIRVGTGEQLVRRVALDSGIWQSAALVYGRRTNDIGLVFTGHPDLNGVGTPASTCADWTDPAGTAALVGLSWSTLSNWWGYGPFPCTSVASVYCVSLP